MVRKKVKLGWIVNDSARRISFNKRKKGLLKKVMELSTLCGVEACATVYGPYDPIPEFWPSPSEAHRVVMRFKSMPPIEQTKKMLNQEGFLKQRTDKVNEQVRRLQRDNHENDMIELMGQCMTGKKGLNAVGIEEISDLAWVVNEKVKAVQERIVTLRGTMAPQMIPNNEIGGGGGKEDNNLIEAAGLHRQPQPWYVDVINPPQEQQPIHLGDGMALPYGNNAPWPNTFFP
ncbi:hypothetical protein IFM89_014356 [Coptis chinensis]|uniref:MADS-box domain-containing protein n=1 Tax=Coptis chinensis TaxID=261450 RepID=A0A835M8W3_9MAGN|nr:hypothetical protein IFM89_014356 [Coptis chinensis]